MVSYQVTDVSSVDNVEVQDRSVHGLDSRNMETKTITLRNVIAGD